MLAEEVTRRLLLTAAPAALAAVGGGYALLEGGLGSSEPATVVMPLVAKIATPLSEGGVIQRLSVTNDVLVQVTSPTVTQVPMQTNGTALRIELTVSKAALDLSKVSLEVSDAGYDADGIEVSYPRTIVLRDVLHGPYNQTAAVNEGPTIVYVALAEQIYNQDERWRTTVTAVHFLAGWMTGAAAEEIAGDAVERADNFPYPRFPVKILTPPFQRLTAEGLPIEITGLHQWGRDNRPFARVEAWTNLGGIDGPVASSSTMVSSAETPPGGTPSGLLAPVYKLVVQHADWRDGAGEVRYRVYPFVGPPWSSVDQGETFPTLGAPRGLPYCQDLTQSWAPLFGVVSPDGIGLAGTDLRGLSFNIPGAIASGLVYKDAASVATAVRTFNRSTVAIQIADGSYARQTNHDDIAGGVAVLCASSGSAVGQNTGAYVIRTGFASQTLYPPGATCFEIRSESGKPDPSIRLRGVSSTGAVMSAATKACPSRLLLRGLWLDGTGTTGAANSVIDGTTTAGQAIVRPTVQSAAYQITYDCVIAENPAAGTGSPARLHPGYVWDVRLNQIDIVGAGSLLMTAAYSGLVCSIGSSYSGNATGRSLPLATILGAKLLNIAISDREDSRYAPVTGALLLNARIDFTTTSTNAALRLCVSQPGRGGIGIGNVFIRSSVDTIQPLMAISNDGVLLECDNLILRHFGHDMLGASSPNNGRVNLLYQDQGYTRIDKRGTIDYCAFRSYNCKGDTFPATEKASSLPATGSWSASNSYFKGAIVWDTPGKSIPTSRFYQALVDINSVQPVPLSDPASWYAIGLVFNKGYGAQPLRQGNAAVRYHTGCHGNVACVTYNGQPPNPNSGYGIAWAADEVTNADFSTFYRDPINNDYRPKNVRNGDMVDSPLLNRVPAGKAILPFDLAGFPRANDGSGAAGAYERISF